MDDRNKISNGPNDRPIGESIAQTAGGLPDDSSSMPPQSAGGKQGEGSAKGKPESPPPPHRLQPDPSEGSREAVEEELKRQPDKKGGQD